MDNKQVFEVVKKLIGNISPIGETNTDNMRYDNLKNMIRLSDDIYTLLNDVLYECGNDNRYSIKRTAEKIKEYFDIIGIKE